MNSLFVNSLYIFEYESKMAKKIDFKHGINILTSDEKSGNDVGKSVLLKSIYHTLGADSIFDHMWNKITKTYILNVTIKNKTYYVYRRDNLFKIYNTNFKKIFMTNNRDELSNYLSDLYSFKVMLPKRENEELELAPPVYSYLLNYIDQDHLDGSKFSSFNSLTQFPNYKENVIYTHFGLFDEEYYKAIKELEILKSEEKNKKKEREVTLNMLNKIKSYLGNLDAPESIEVLNIELNKTKEEYSNIVINLQKIKNNLMKIRNEKVDLELNIKEIELTRRNEMKKLKVKNVCPSCSHEIEDIDSKFIINNQIEDLIILKDELESEIIKCNRVIEKKEEEYQSLLDKLHEYESNMKINDDSISNVLKHKAYIDTKDDIVLDLEIIDKKIKEIQQTIEPYDKKIKEYNSLKKKANAKYEELMKKAKKDFGLEEIDENKIKNIKNNFIARGSNRAITTIMWYLTLLAVKYEFNENAIKFPLILDSPNNVESDEIKEESLFKYIFKNTKTDTQLILSSLGFNEMQFSEFKFDNIIKLENSKYNLLNKEDYYNNIDILNKIFEN
ncbi:TPA: hypothetical protein KN209_000908 [Clostridioides difficile]|uniref:DUF2326 domain-containing protein n=9 Tax=Clostridioides difficile TaxID=1496 RepID=A0A9P3TY06_CLODI|nr:hypothetical protein [Clostridioides difficile]EQG74185.1 hypothetical protein QKA_3950 [Clostridioides difficile DA00165]OFU06927.1 hypothetical protein HMPREF3081_13855 [Clostridium sp. HMSC19D02]OFU08339.1 hypothetical protein HMPREF3083_03930 [Clostridium sp. HMSC19D07]OFU30126.1 hypothetical protein HMPREF3075_10900 [Clostridium sp. HMSC19B11]AWH78786.1 hypothetical protein DDG61_16845 [Clostridioides difficile]